MVVPYLRMTIKDTNLSSLIGILDRFIPSLGVMYRLFIEIHLLLFVWTNIEHFYIIPLTMAVRPEANILFDIDHQGTSTRELLSFYISSHHWMVGVEAFGVSLRVLD